MVEHKLDLVSPGVLSFSFDLGASKPKDGTKPQPILFDLGETLLCEANQ